MEMDTEWIYYPRDTKTYREGAQQYVDNLCSNSGNPPTMRCPCCKCVNMKWHEPKVVFGHICMNAIHPIEVNHILHPEGSTSTQHQDVQVPETYYMLKDALCDDEVVMEAMDEMNDEEMIKIIEDAELPVFSGCSATTIASIVSIFKYKARFNLPDNAIDELFPLIKNILPDGNTLPGSLYAARKVLKAFDLGYQKIHACVNDCCLFRKELEDAESCPKCGTSRWKVDIKSKKVMKGVPAKVLRYFPIIPRLRRMFKSLEKSKQLTWHDKHKSQDGKMRHPVDSPAWKHIDSRWPAFASEPRNMRLGLAADGFNPFGDFTSRYSCWPVILMTYNLSPSLCMSKENLMLTLLIPGPKQPGNDIDVYLQPLVEDLKELWDKGVRVYDACTESSFNLKAILMWTINDFPAYGNLSGYSTKGKKACPVCGVQTCSKWLENGKKHVFMGHRKWLPEDHPYRFKAGWFDGTVERRTKPIYLNGSQIFEVVKPIVNDWGKKVKKDMVSRKRKRAETTVDINNESDDDGDNPLKLTKRWKKRSIFYDLPYWEALLIRHNLDLMHVEKNICESLLGTLLNMKGKTKDNPNSRKDLKKMGIRKRLHLKNDDLRTFKHTTPTYVLSKHESKIFCERIASLRMPDGYSSNIAKKVVLEEKKILGLKSHDCHVLMQQVLPVALRGLLPKGPRIAIFRLCTTFNRLCQRVLDDKELEKLEQEVPETLCMLERFFPPSFFDVMVHLTLHLVEEARIGGPVHLRWMYPPERFMKTLKNYVKNRSNPEGCIAEKYLADELTKFCSGYYKQAADVGLQNKRNEDLEDDDLVEGRGFGRKRKIMSPKMLQIAHRFVLLNLIELEPLRNVHKDELKRSDARLSRNAQQLETRHVDSFGVWLSSLVTTGVSHDISNLVRWISCGPKQEVVSCSGFIINGNRFHTKDNEKSTQNSGVFVEGDTYCRASAKDNAARFDTVNYYGVIKDIILLDYHDFKVPLFHCDWANIAKGVKMDEGFTLVNLHEGQHQFEMDPFIFASQAKQVFYSKENATSNWFVVLKAPPRGFYEEENFYENEYISCAPLDISQLDISDDEDCLLRNNDESNEYSSIDEASESSGQ